MVASSKYLFLLFVFFVFSGIVIPQEKQIDNKKKELENLKSEIQSIENELKQKSSREKKSIDSHDKIKRQNFLLNKIVLGLKSEEKLKDKQIQQSENIIEQIEKDIKELRRNYSKYIVAIYKYGRVDELEGILDAESFQQAMLRYQYLKNFSQKRQSDLIQFQENKDELILTKKKLEIEKEEKHKLVVEKSKEENNLKQKLKDEKKVIDSIKKDKASLNKKLKTKRDAEHKISDLIVRLVEEAERKRKEFEAKKNKPVVVVDNKTDSEIETYPEFNLDLSTAKFKSFSELKGRLNWPVKRGKVIRKFGESKNEVLKTVTVNYGVDIKASGDLGVISVAEGVISAVEWIPGYGSVLIISHKGDYRTVYSHLAEIYVNEGDKVIMGSQIARIGESIEGNVLHFEIWNSRKNVNPEDWFRK